MNFRRARFPKNAPSNPGTSATGSARSGSARSGSTRNGSARSGSARSGSARSGSAPGTAPGTAPGSAADPASGVSSTIAGRAFAVRRTIPVSVEIAGHWAWRLLAIAGVLLIFGLLVVKLTEIVVPFLIAILISALLSPSIGLLRRHSWPRWLAIVVVLGVAVILVTGLVFLVVSQIRSGLPGLEKQATAAYGNFRQLLSDSPLHLTNSQFNDYLGNAIKAIQKNSSALAASALRVGSTAGHLLTGALLVLFSIIFLLIDGRGVWNWVVRLFPRRARAAVGGAGETGWLTLTTFVRVQVFVAAVNALGVGLFAFFLALPLALPIAIVVFLASFIPLVGAIATGVIAVLIALVFVGPLQAVIMLGGVVLVHLLEAHVLQPLVLGSAVKVHPLAVVLGVAAGTYVAGIPGALFAVPVIATVNVMVLFIAGGTWRVGSAASANGGADPGSPGG